MMDTGRRILCCIAFFCCIYSDEQILRYHEALVTDAYQREALAEQVMTRTPPKAVISARFGGYLHMKTGRKLVQQVPSDDAIAAFYPDGRPFLGCGRVVTKGLKAADKKFIDERLINYLNATGATHVVPIEVQGTYYRMLLRHLLRTQPSALQLVGTAEPCALYRINAPLR